MVVGTGLRHCYQHDPDRSEERKRNASRGGRSRGNGEIADLKGQLKKLAADVLDSKVERGDAVVVNQILNTRVRLLEQERRIRETQELAARLEALEEVLKGRPDEQERVAPDVRPPGGG